MVEVSAGIGALVVQSAAARGVSVEQLRARTGFDPAIAADPDARIPLTMETALWDEAARLSGDAAFGLHAAEGVRAGLFDVFDYAVRTAPTVRAALDRAARSNRLLHDAAVFTVLDAGEATRVEHALGSAQQSRHAAEFTLASMLVVGGQMTGERPRPLAVEFRHASPPDVREHLRTFGVAPRFSAAVNAIQFDRAALLHPVPAADPALWRVIERHAEALLAARPDPAESAANRVRRILAGALGEGEGAASLASVADRLKLSERSLQRRLADEGVSFDALLEELRHELAVRYLADRKISIAEVAYLLGYSEPSAFHRAFKRWTGKTPAEVRRRAA